MCSFLSCLKESVEEKPFLKFIFSYFLCLRVIFRFVKNCGRALTRGKNRLWGRQIRFSFNFPVPVKFVLLNSLRALPLDHSLSLSLSLSHKHSHSLSLKHTHTHTPTHTFNLTKSASRAQSILPKEGLATIFSIWFICYMCHVWMVWVPVKGLIDLDES